MNASSVRVIITNGVESYSAEMVTIAGAVVVVIVGFFVLRAGLRMLRASDNGLSYSDQKIVDAYADQYRKLR